MTVGRNTKPAGRVYSAAPFLGCFCYACSRAIVRVANSDRKTSRMVNGTLTRF